MKKPLLLSMLSFGLALATGACNGGHDWYADVAPACVYKHAPGMLVSSPVAPDVHADCRTALKSILPFDDTWKNAPEGMEDKVLEAFQTIMSYELDWPKENRIFGLAPYSIPLWHVDMVESDSPRQKAIFNNVVDVISSITYGGPSDTVSAKLTPRLSLSGGLLTIYDPFVWYDTLFGANYTNAFPRAATIIHEAHHGDGTVHEQCPDEGDWECDPELGGPFGMEVTYLELLLHGSGNKSPDGTPSPLSKTDIRMIGTQLCLQLHNLKSEYLKPELRDFAKNFGCWAITSDWVIKQEGLIR